MRLPWEHLANGYNQKELHSIRTKMTDEEIEVALPKPFRPIYSYLRSLSFEAEPDYDKIVSFYEDLLLESTRSHRWLRGEACPNNNALKTSACLAISAVTFSKTAIETPQARPRSRKSKSAIFSSTRHIPKWPKKGTTGYSTFFRKAKAETRPTKMDTPKGNHT